jgi:hypothetical protein
MKLLYAVCLILPFSNYALSSQNPAINNPNSFHSSADTLLLEENINKATKGDADALKWIIQKASEGNSDAQCALGTLYLIGTGVTKDPEKAISWIAKAAEQENVIAENILYGLYSMCAQKMTTKEKVQKFIEEMAEKTTRQQIKAEVQFRLAALYESGRFVPQDIKKALKFCQEAEKYGHPKAQCMLGMMYAYGIGVTKDIAKAIDLYQKSAQQDFEEAQYALGNIYIFLAKAFHKTIKKLLNCFKNLRIKET